MGGNYRENPTCDLRRRDEGLSALLQTQAKEEEIRIL